MIAAGDRDGALGVLDDELEAQVARSFCETNPTFTEKKLLYQISSRSP